LRQILVPTAHEGEISDDRIFDLLREFDLERVLTPASGLDTDQNWETLLSLREQQLLACIHLFLAAFLDRVGTALVPNKSTDSANAFREVDDLHQQCRSR
jgi:vitamin B12/bleomycin/antimicrobial peptide transport system ATP-binding/permease protein